MKEVQLQHYAGPFSEVPYEYFIQSPIGLVPKAGNKMWLIFHLSYDFEGNCEARKSVNFHTPDNLCSVKYRDLDFAIKASLKMKLLASDTFQQLVYSKTDAVSAFHLLPILPSQCCWLILKASHPVTKKVFYFVDKCLPFGSSISCAQFQSFLDALAHIMQTKAVTFTIITNYLDNFLIISYTIQLCNELMEQFLKLCSTIGCPTSDEKTEWGLLIMTFLGMLLNGQTLTISILVEKKHKALNLLNTVLYQKKTTI